MTDNTQPPVMPAEDGHEQPQPAPEQPLVSDPDAQRLLNQVVERMGKLTPEEALRRSLETVLVMYQSRAQGGRPVIRYAKTKTEQQINLPGAS